MTNKDLKTRRAIRVRARFTGTSERPRLSVYRSLKHISAQLIDDTKGLTIAFVGDHQLKGIEGKTKIEIAGLVGAQIAAKAQEKKIKKIVFDRGSYAYFGRVKALAQAAREKGLEF